jgi:TolB protein
MDSSKKFLTTFDKLLIAGLGCGLVGLCILACGFIYTFRNPPQPPPSATQTPLGSGGPALMTPVLITPTLSLFTPTTFPTLPPTLVDQTPVPLPPIGNTSLSGKIVFTCFVQQIDQICLMNADGSGRRQLTDFDATSFYASLSPDGETIYFVSRKDGPFEIYSMNLNGRNVERLTNGIGALYAPELSPNGNRIIFTNHGNGIWIMRADGNNPRPLTTRDDIDPTWSPDGSMIAFASNRSGERQLYVMNYDGSNITQITDLNNMGGRSTWSPDGTKLAFYRGPAGDRNIFIVNVDGSNVTRLTSGGDNLGPSWSPDGNWIAFTSFRDGNNEIYIIRPDGTGLTRLTESPISDWQPRWGR